LKDESHNLKQHNSSLQEQLRLNSDWQSQFLAIQSQFGTLQLQHNAVQSKLALAQVENATLSSQNASLGSQNASLQMELSRAETRHQVPSSRYWPQLFSTQRSF
jgi:hypothetical protein